MVREEAERRGEVGAHEIREAREGGQECPVIEIAQATQHR